MNANELANYITQNSYIGTVTMEDVATMLRQQQTEIEAFTQYLDETCQIGKFIVWNSTDKELEK
jgi:hypothetical protein